MKSLCTLTAIAVGLSISAPVSALSEPTNREVWVLAKSHEDLPSTFDLQGESSCRPKVIIASAYDSYALNHEISSADGIYYESVPIVLSEDGDSIVGGITDDITFSFSYFSAINNNHFYSFSRVTDDIADAPRFVINMNEKVLWFSHSQEMSWDVEFLNEESGICNIVAMTTGGSKLSSSYYPYVKYKSESRTFTNDTGANSKTSEEYALRLYVSRTEIVREPPRMPEIFIDDYGQIFDGCYIDLSESAEPRIVTIPSREGVSFYYRFTEDGAVESEFQNYCSPIEVSRAGHLEIYAQDESTELKSAILVIHFIGVIASEAEAPEAPVLYMDENQSVVSGQTVNLSETTGPQFVTIEAGDGLCVYYRYIIKLETDAEFELYTEPIEITKAGLIDFYAEDPKTKLQSPMQTVYFIGEPVPAGITEIELNEATGRYFDILGRPVSSPNSSHGILLLKSESGVMKIRI